MNKELENYKKVQRTAKDTIVYLRKVIKSGMTEREIAGMAEKYMKEHGVPKFWYYGIGAFVLVGKRTTISISGREYAPTDEALQDSDIVSIDLSPEIDSYWGDFARTLTLENGVVVGENSTNEEFNEGWKVENALHKEFTRIVKPEMAFQEVYHLLNKKITELGYENLDFNGNLGHSIEKNKDDRKYFEKGEETLLKDVALFTFEPHNRKKGGEYGYKRENIYYFECENLEVL
mgnify:FL=1